jgi:hypothetical protein
MADGRTGPSERRVSRRGGRRGSEAARSDADLLRRAWEDRQGSEAPFARHGDRAAFDERAGKEAVPADASDDAVDQRPK